PKPPGLAYRFKTLDPTEQQLVVERFEHLDAEARQRLGSQLVRIEWAGTVDVTADEVLARGAGGRGDSKVEQAMAWLPTFLAGGAKLSDDVVEAGQKVGFSRRTLFNARKKLGDSVRAVRRDNQWFWELNQSLPELLKELIPEPMDS